MFFFRKIWYALFSETPVLRFTLLPYDRRFHSQDISLGREYSLKIPQQ